MRRKSRNLDEPPDFILGPPLPRMLRYWLREGPSDGTHVEVPEGTETVWVEHPAVEVALRPEDALPRVALYQRDRDMASGGFNVFRYVESLTEMQIRAVTADPDVIAPVDDRARVGEVADSPSPGGGYFSVFVDRDLPSYPDPGQTVWTSRARA